MISYTKHATIRARQRGVPPLVVYLLEEYGDRVYDGHGGVRVFFSARSIRRMESALGRRPVGKLSEYLGSYMVVSSDGAVVITVGHRVKRIKRR